MTKTQKLSLAFAGVAAFAAMTVAGVQELQAREAAHVANRPYVEIDNDQELTMGRKHPSPIHRRMNSAKRTA